jgi:hypothetical protein
MGDGHAGEVVEERLVHHRRHDQLHAADRIRKYVTEPVTGPLVEETGDY